MDAGRFLLRMEPELHTSLKADARAAGLSLNEHCVRRLSAPWGGGAVEGPAAEVVSRAREVAGAALAGVLVFGSWARGEAVAASDVDVLVVLEPAAAVHRGLYRAWDAQALLWEGHAVEPHFARLPDPTATASGLWAEAALDGIVLFDPAHVVARALASVRSQIAAGRVVRRWANGQPYWVAA